MKESDSVEAHINEYESISSQLSAEGMTIEDDRKALVLMSNLPPSRETFVTTVCNTGATMQYPKVKSSMLIEDAQRKLFLHDLARDIYVV